MSNASTEARQPAPAVNDDSSVRETLLSSVAAIRPALIEAASRSEAAGTLDGQAVAALRSAELWNMRLMRELGGLEVSINTQIAVLTALAEIDAASAWCTMVANNAVGTIGAYMGDTAVTEVFKDGIPACAAVAAPEGRAISAPGGYRVTGTWRFASGIRHTDWIVASTLVDGDPARPILMVLRTAQVTIHDTWHVIGLRGTGSCDFSVEDHFVPEHLTVPAVKRLQLRGSRLYARSGIILAVYEHHAFALGLGRRALRELTVALVAGKGSRLAADREVVQSEVARLAIQLDAVESEARSYYASIEAVADLPTLEVDPMTGTKGRALAAWATEVAAECITAGFQRMGGLALYTPNPFEQLKRDIAAAQAHVLVNDAAFAAYGAAIFEEAGKAR
jgi:indole-3-acetate monooxygenase